MITSYCATSNDIKIGNKYWIFNNNSTSSFNYYRTIKITCCIAVGINDRIYLRDISTGVEYLVVSNGFCYKKDFYICDTFEEAVEEWNSIVYDDLDRLTSFYEKKLKLIKNKLILNNP